jgi:hypothetical protein
VDHELESFEHLEPILDWIDLRVSVDRLDWLNLDLNHTEIKTLKNAGISFGCKSEIVYSRVRMPNRLIHMNLIPANKSTHL